MNENEYSVGDIVWVKIGGRWWPGQIVDFEKLPEDIKVDFEKRKLPLYTVGFFQENSYEFIKNLDQICHYNCAKKDQFIKRGMDLFRAKDAAMEKFPADVITAERLTGGDENLLSDVKYGPTQKIDLSSIFGSPSKKKRGSTGKGRNSFTKSPGVKKTSRKQPEYVTHRRFIGYNDHQVRILTQKSDTADKPENEKTYDCNTCNFSTSHIDIMFMHNKTHIQGAYKPVYSSKNRKRASNEKFRKKVQIPTSDSVSIEEDLISIAKEPQVIYKKYLDVQKDIIPDWDDDNEENASTTSPDKPEEGTPPSSESSNKEKETSDSTEIINKDNSCFDFNEEEEVDTAIISTSGGRKIPRVIPETRKSIDPAVDSNQPSVEVPPSIEVTVEKSNDGEKSEDELAAITELLGETAVPAIPELPQTLKCEQNFHKTRTIKFPDKSVQNDETKNESASKLINPKKRIVKSFADFELSLRAQEEQNRKETKETFETEGSNLDHARSCEDIESILRGDDEHLATKDTLKDKTQDDPLENVYAETHEIEPDLKSAEQLSQLTSENENKNLESSDNTEKEVTLEVEEKITSNEDIKNKDIIEEDVKLPKYRKGRKSIKPNEVTVEEKAAAIDEQKITRKGRSSKEVKNETDTHKPTEVDDEESKTKESAKKEMIVRKTRRSQKMEENISFEKKEVDESPEEEIKGKKGRKSAKIEETPSKIPIIEEKEINLRKGRRSHRKEDLKLTLEEERWLKAEEKRLEAEANAAEEEKRKEGTQNELNESEQRKEIATRSSKSHKFEEPTPETPDKKGSSKIEELIQSQEIPNLKQIEEDSMATPKGKISKTEELADSQEVIDIAKKEETVFPVRKGRTRKSAEVSMLSESFKDDDKNVIQEEKSMSLRKGRSSKSEETTTISEIIDKKEKHVEEEKIGKQIPVRKGRSNKTEESASISEMEDKEEKPIEEEKVSKEISVRKGRLNKIEESAGISEIVNIKERRIEEEKVRELPIRKGRSSKIEDSMAFQESHREDDKLTKDVKETSVRKRKSSKVEESVFHEEISTDKDRAKIVEGEKEANETHVRKGRSRKIEESLVTEVSKIDDQIMIDQEMPIRKGRSNKDGESIMSADTSKSDKKDKIVEGKIIQTRKGRNKNEESALSQEIEINAEETTTRKTRRSARIEEVVSDDQDTKSTVTSEIKVHTSLTQVDHESTQKKTRRSQKIDDQEKKKEVLETNEIEENSNKQSKTRRGQKISPEVKADETEITQKRTRHSQKAEEKLIEADKSHEIDITEHSEIKLRKTRHGRKIEVKDSEEPKQEDLAEANESTDDMEIKLKKARRGQKIDDIIDEKKDSIEESGNDVEMKHKSLRRGQKSNKATTDECNKSVTESEGIKEPTENIEEAKVKQKRSRRGQKPDDAISEGKKDWRMESKEITTENTEVADIKHMKTRSGQRIEREEPKEIVGEKSEDAENKSKRVRRGQQKADETITTKKEDSEVEQDEVTDGKQKRTRRDQKIEKASSVEMRESVVQSKEIITESTEEAETKSKKTRRGQKGVEVISEKKEESKQSAHETTETALKKTRRGQMFEEENSEKKREATMASKVIAAESTEASEPKSKRTRRGQKVDEAISSKQEDSAEKYEDTDTQLQSAQHGQRVEEENIVKIKESVTEFKGSYSEDVETKSKKLKIQTEEIPHADTRKQKIQNEQNTKPKVSEEQKKEHFVSTEIKEGAEKEKYETENKIMDMPKAESTSVTKETTISEHVVIRQRKSRWGHKIDDKITDMQQQSTEIKSKDSNDPKRDITTSDTIIDNLESKPKKDNQKVEEEIINDEIIKETDISEAQKSKEIESIYQRKKRHQKIDDAMGVEDTDIQLKNQNKEESVSKEKQVKSAILDQNEEKANKVEVDAHDTTQIIKESVLQKETEKAEITQISTNEADKLKQKNYESECKEISKTDFGDSKSIINEILNEEKVKVTTRGTRRSFRKEMIEKVEKEEEKKEMELSTDEKNAAMIEDKIETIVNKDIQVLDVNIEKDVQAKEVRGRRNSKSPIKLIVTEKNLELEVSTQQQVDQENLKNTEDINQNNSESIKDLDKETKVHENIDKDNTIHSKEGSTFEINVNVKSPEKVSRDKTVEIESTKTDITDKNIIESEIPLSTEKGSESVSFKRSKRLRNLSEEIKTDEMKQIAMSKDTSESSKTSKNCYEDCLPIKKSRLRRHSKETESIRDTKLDWLVPKKTDYSKRETILSSSRSEFQSTSPKKDEGVQKAADSFVLNLKSQLMTKLKEPLKISKKTTRASEEKESCSKTTRRPSLQSEEIMLRKSREVSDESLKNKDISARSPKPKEMLFEVKENFDISSDVDIIANEVINNKAVVEMKPNDMDGSEKSLVSSMTELVDMEMEELTTKSIVENKPSKIIVESGEIWNTLATISEPSSMEMVQGKQEINIERNLTVVSEKDLQDGQVEIAKIPIIKEGTIKAATVASITEFKSDPTSFEENIEVRKLKLETSLPAVITEKVKEQTITEIIQESTQNSSKLMEMLRETKAQQNIKQQSLKIANPTFDVESNKNSEVNKPKNEPAHETSAILKQKLLLQQCAPGSSKQIRSEKLSQESNLVSVQKVSSKRSYEDFEDIDAFIIQKPSKRILQEKPLTRKLQTIVKPAAPKTKPTILGQTIIKPGGEVILQSNKEETFDIDSMPIVLEDQILTPENIDSMPMIIQESVSKPSSSIIRKIPQQQMKLLNKGSASFRGMPTGKTYSKIKPTTSTIVKPSSTVPSTLNKSSKFIIVSNSETPSKYTVGKRLTKKSPSIINKMQSVTQEPTGNKIMIVTNNQGRQSRVLLTPALQKTIGYQTTKKTIIKDPTKTPNIISQTIINPKGQITTTNPGLTPVKKRIEQKNKLLGQKLVMQSGFGSIKSTPGQHKTIIIKNPQGQTVKKIHGTDDATIEQQVAEQIEAINRAASASAQNKVIKRYPKKSGGDVLAAGVPSRSQVILNSASTSQKTLPPLAPITPPKKVEPQVTNKLKAKVNPPAVSTPTPQPSVSATPTTPISEEKDKDPKRSPHQLVIQDAYGNQTTITEGQILALPSETVDGQPQSYILVTLDESGNLTPLSNEAVMSLDPKLNLGSDGGNMVLDIDPSSEEKPSEQVEAVPIETTVETTVTTTEELTTPIIENIIPEEQPIQETMQAVACNINNGDTNQQLIITGDPVTTQKFLESLSEGNADLANLLASAEGSNILIHADGQQILINTDADNQMLFTLNSDPATSIETSESTSNPTFASQVPKNQDILAAALADTDVFQQEQSIVPSSSKVSQSQLSPSGALYPINVNNVLETSSMNSPIMTPLVVPSTNSKKIDDETDILTQVPKNVDLPITITDPNIAQSVSHQQIMTNELQTLELPLSIQDVTVTSAEMSSPSFSYPLPNLDDTDKTFTSSISMPLLTEEPEEIVTTSNSNLSSEIIEKSDKEYLLSTGNICSMNNQISSLSEPPPDMFDFTIEQNYDKEIVSTDVDNTNSPGTDDSCEIPVQPEIITPSDISSPKRCFDGDLESENKKCKFD